MSTELTSQKLKDSKSGIKKKQQCKLQNAQN